MRCKVIVIAALAMALVQPAQAQEQVSIGASGSGSGPYVNGALIADTLNKSQSGFRFSVQTTGGYKDNLGLILTDKVDLALNSLINMEFAYNQRGDFGTSPMAGDFKRLRYVFSFGAVPENFFVRSDSGIASLGDIRGKAFNINVPASFTHGLNLTLLEAAGISTDDFEAGMVSTGQVFDEVQNGVFAGGLHVYQLGLGKAQRLSSTTGITYLDIPDDIIARMNETYHGLLVPYEIPAGTYAGQDEPVSTFGIAQVIITDENADEEMVYEFTRAFWEKIGALQAANTSFSGMTPEKGAKDFGVPMHPGAERYFREIGVR